MQMSPDLNGDDVRALAFRRAGFGQRSYVVDEVDAFLDRVDAALDRIEATVRRRFG